MTPRKSNQCTNPGIKKELVARKKRKETTKEIEKRAKEKNTRSRLLVYLPTTTVRRLSCNHWSCAGEVQPQRRKSRAYHEGFKLKFSHQNLADLKDWRKKACLILSINRTGLVRIMKEDCKPEGCTTPARLSATDKATTLAQAQATHKEASQNLYTILYLITKKPPQVLVPKQKDENGIGGNGQKAWHELESKFLKITDEVIRVKLAQLAATSMNPGQDTDDYFMLAIL